MGSDREAGKTHWIEQLEEIKNFFIRKIIEARTIGDLLAMKKSMETRQQEEKRQDEDPKGPK